MLSPMRPPSLFPLFAEVSTLKGVGPKILPLVQKLAGPLVRDLLFLSPSGLIVRRPMTATTAIEGQVGIFEVVVDRLIVPGKPGALEVRFGPEWLSWIPAVWADYWVVDLDPDYRWAVVGGPDRDAMWILSRTPALDKATFDDIRNRAKRRGYPVAELLISPDVK